MNVDSRCAKEQFTMQGWNGGKEAGDGREKPERNLKVIPASAGEAITAAARVCSACGAKNRAWFTTNPTKGGWTQKLRLKAPNPIKKKRQERGEILY